MKGAIPIPYPQSKGLEIKRTTTQGFLIMLRATSHSNSSKRNRNNHDGTRTVDAAAPSHVPRSKESQFKNQIKTRSYTMTAKHPA